MIQDPETLIFSFKLCTCFLFFGQKDIAIVFQKECHYCHCTPNLRVTRTFSSLAKFISKGKIKIRYFSNRELGGYTQAIDFMRGK